ncbi:MAG: hypothetical protein ACK55Z_27235, partial [bacterium]
MVGTEEGRRACNRQEETLCECRRCAVCCSPSWASTRTAAVWSSSQGRAQVRPLAACLRRRLGGWGMSATRARAALSLLANWQQMHRLS